ncbi:PREDICTED: collagen alpha-1(II) chain-like [Chinchilla lanigera]|uniref:collagen alpha-1(II) chain-like n=1 Tax=Chinchilla lanigera TaxID=34839 RepID=UPI000697B949|nr:PREDICTED: collagen alpha-1(II) chain-like [Chinchilla lanigera]
MSQHQGGEGSIKQDLSGSPRSVLVNLSHVYHSAVERCSCSVPLHRPTRYLYFRPLPSPGLSASSSPPICSSRVPLLTGLRLLLIRPQTVAKSCCRERRTVSSKLGALPPESSPRASSAERKQSGPHSANRGAQPGLLFTEVGYSSAQPVLGAQRGRLRGPCRQRSRAERLDSVRDAWSPRGTMSSAGLHAAVRGEGATADGSAGKGLHPRPEGCAGGTKCAGRDADRRSAESPRRPGVRAWTRTCGERPEAGASVSASLVRACQPAYRALGATTGTGGRKGQTLLAKFITERDTLPPSPETAARPGTPRRPPRGPESSLESAPRRPSARRALRRPEWGPRAVPLRVPRGSASGRAGWPRGPARALRGAVRALHPRVSPGRAWALRGRQGRAPPLQRPDLGAGPGMPGTRPAARSRPRRPKPAAAPCQLPPRNEAAPRAHSTRNPLRRAPREQGPPGLTAPSSAAWGGRAPARAGRRTPRADQRPGHAWGRARTPAHRVQ